MNINTIQTINMVQYNFYVKFIRTFMSIDHIIDHQTHFKIISKMNWNDPIIFLIAIKLKHISNYF